MLLSDGVVDWAMFLACHKSKLLAEECYFGILVRHGKNVNEFH